MHVSPCNICLGAHSPSGWKQAHCKFLYNSKPSTTSDRQDTASFPEDLAFQTGVMAIAASSVQMRMHLCMCVCVCALVCKKEPARKTLTRGPSQGPRQATHLPSITQPTQGSSTFPPSRICTCCFFRTEGPSSHSPSVNSYSVFPTRKSHPSGQSRQSLPLWGLMQQRPG
jgi:hypothetical protein